MASHIDFLNGTAELVMPKILKGLNKQDQSIRCSANSLMNHHHHHRLTSPKQRMLDVLVRRYVFTCYVG